jgi:hypothetical protein
MSNRTKYHSPPAFPMKAIIICDDLIFASYAASTIARVGSQAASTSNGQRNAGQ